MIEPGSSNTLGTYYPTRSSLHDDYSRRILALKWIPGNIARAMAVDYFYSCLDPIIPPGWAIAYFPSSSPNNINTGVCELARRLAAPNRIDATGCLIRITGIPPSHQSRIRNQEQHLNSIVVHDAHLINDRDVLVLDDVTTSGSSLGAARTLLKHGGARSVATMAMGQTSYG